MLMQTVSPLNNIRSMKSGVTKKPGDFCRIKQDNGNVEAVVIDVEEKQQKVKIRTIGYGVEMTMAVKELYPSQGKDARSKQEQDATQILNGIKWSLKDQCLAPFGDNKEMKLAVIYELQNDESGNQYAIVSSIDTNLALEATVWTTDLKPPPQMTWNVGDNCRAEWSEDNVIYESVILAFGEHNGRKYANLEFYGYLNQDNVWMEALMPSHGAEAIEAQKQEAGYIEPQPKVAKVYKPNDRCRAVLSEDNVEYEATVKTVNDDGTCLVHFIGLNKDETKTVTSLKSSAGSEARAKQREAAAKPTKAVEWSEGMNCRAVFSEDGLEYEGNVQSIGSAENGAKYAIVKFIGYGNEESVWLDALMASKGEEIRAQQIKEASADGGDEVDAAPPAAITEATPAPQVNGVASDWKVGDDCRAIFQDDNLEYEGQIEEITATDDGSKYATIKFHGYGDIVTAWVADIIPSNGPQAKEAQIKASKEENGGEANPPATTEEKAPVVTDEKPAIVEKVHQDNVKDLNKSQEVVKSPNTSLDEPNIWKVNDVCRAFSKELKKEIQCTIHQLHPSKKEIVKVKFANGDGADIIEIKNISELKAEENGTIDTVDAGRPVTPEIITNAVSDIAEKTTNSGNSESSTCESEASTVVEVTPLPKSSSPTPVVAADINNNDCKPTIGPILEATKILAEQLDADKVIKDLRIKLEEKEKKLSMAHERNEVNEIIFREMRLANSQLQAENTRLKENEQKYHETQAILMADIKTLLAKLPENRSND